MWPNNPPYIGPRPFGEADREIFYGRDREAQELLSLIVSHSETLLYARPDARQDIANQCGRDSVTQTMG